MLWILLLILLLNNPILAVEKTVIVNKFQYNPLDSKNEWVELYNPNETEIDLNDWYLVDESNTKKLLTGVKISPKNFYKFEDGKSWLNNTTSNNDGDTIFLKIGDSIIDSVDYKRNDGKMLVKGQNVSESDLILKGKWIGRKSIDSEEWQIYADTDGPTGGYINYFDGYKTILEKINIGITIATDYSGIGTTEIKMFESVLNNNTCLNFNNIDIGNSLNDGRCYKYEYVATDGVGNSAVFISNSIVKYDTTKPFFNINNAFRNILKFKSEFDGVDLESGIASYKYGLGETIDKYIGNGMLYMGYEGEPTKICGMAVNNAGLESEINCLGFVIDLTTPKIINQINPENGKYKIGDILNFNFEFDENIETAGNNFEIELNNGKANFTTKTDKILNFEYIVKSGDLTNNLAIGLTNIAVNSGSIFDLAGNEADLRINNLENGIIIDGIIPQINLIGETYVEIAQFDNYLELGATASDIPDGNLTDKIIVDNNVDINIGGIYENYYSVTDSAGNINSVVRKVKVVDITPPLIKINNSILESNEDGYVEWMGKCMGEDNNIFVGENNIKIKNNGDGIYDDCKIRAWDKWGNVGEWNILDSFIVDTTPPLIEFVAPTPDNNIFINNNEISVMISSNEKLKSCSLEKENNDNWEGDWIIENGYKKSPVLKDADLIEKSMWQNIVLESDGELSFLWKVSSEKDWDFLKFYIDEVLMNKISGEVNWQEQKYSLSKGNHTVKFTYSKDYSGESGDDAGWIDNVSVTNNNMVSMSVLNNIASAKIVNLLGGSTKYKVYCTDEYNNKSEIIERKIIKNIENVEEDDLPTPTPYTIFKTSAIIPTIKLAKLTTVKSTVKKVSTVLGVIAIPTPDIKITPPSGTKLKSNVPWEEIKFWAMGMLTLITTSGVILLDKKVI